MSTLQKHFDRATAVLSLPFALAHEFTHFAVAHAVTREAQMAITLTETGDGSATDIRSSGGVVAWPPIESSVLRVFAHLSPTVFGLVLMGLWGWSGVTIDGWRLILAIGLFWYTVPSPDDLSGAFGRQAVQQEDT